MDAPIDRSSSWPYTDGQPASFSYARADNPTNAAVEAELGQLEGGRALLFPSGMAAVTTTVLALTRPGQTVAIAAGAYYGHLTLLDHLAPWGLTAVEFDQTGPPPADVDLILLEAPANPLLTMPDFEAAAAHTATVVCDSTVASPLRVRPLDLGCEIALHSATKVMGGHDDALAGVVAVRDDALYARIRTTRQLTGIVAAPDTAWLLHRGLKTLAVRLDRQESTARILAERLQGHPAVSAVRYPGFSFLISFDVADAAAALRVETALGVIENATSLGGVRTKLESRHRWEGDRIPTGLLRLSVGLEEPETLWADLAQALATV
jgi:cystathionine gamma-synthase